MEKILEFIYNEKSISFDPTGNDNVMVNATEMAKVFGKRIDNFLRLDYVNEFIEVLIKILNDENEFPPNGGNSEQKSKDEFPHIRGNSIPITKDDILQTRGQNGTWMHRYLAIKFAAWMDPYFDVWIIKTTDRILLGHYREVKAAMYERLIAEKKRDSKREELLKANPEFIKFLELEGKITESEKKRVRAVRASMDQFKIQFQERK